MTELDVLLLRNVMISEFQERVRQRCETFSHFYNSSQQQRAIRRILRAFRRSRRRRMLLNNVGAQTALYGQLRSPHGRVLLCPLTLSPLCFRDAFLLRHPNGHIVAFDGMALASWFCNSARFICPSTTLEVDAATIERLQVWCRKQPCNGLFRPEHWVFDYSYQNRQSLLKGITETENLIVGLERSCDNLLSASIDLCTMSSPQPIAVIEGLIIFGEDLATEEPIDENQKFTRVAAIIDEWRQMIDQSAQIAATNTRQLLNRHLFRVTKDMSVLSRVGSNAFGLIVQAVRGKHLQYKHLGQVPPPPPPPPPPPSRLASTTTRVSSRPGTTSTKRRRTVTPRL